MKNQPNNSILLILSLLFIGIAGGCNLPGATRPTEVSPDAVYTMAAQTVIAHYTLEAGVPPTEGDTPAETATITLLVPTPLEPTQTPEPTQTLEPTETATQIVNTIMEDDFSNTSLWYVFESDDYTIEYQDGSYRIYNQFLNGAIWSIKYQDYADIRIEVDATRKAGPDDGYYGVICRFGDEGNEYYALVINDSGFYGIIKMEDGENKFLGSGTDQNDIIKKGIGKTNRVRGVCSGEQLVLYVNDQQLLEIEDDSLTEGEIGLVAGNRLSDVGIEVIFDNFALISP